MVKKKDDVVVLLEQQLSSNARGRRLPGGNTRDEKKTSHSKHLGAATQFFFLKV